jgi:hypothetical protein
MHTGRHVGAVCRGEINNEDRQQNHGYAGNDTILSRAQGYGFPSGRPKRSDARDTRCRVIYGARSMTSTSRARFRNATRTWTDALVRWSEGIGHIAPRAVPNARISIAAGGR